MSNLKNRFLGVMALCWLYFGATCLADQQRIPIVTPASAKREIRVLFLGNSLTAANDLPAMVQAMAAASGVKLTYKAITQGGFNLEDHWNDRQSLPALTGEKWDYLVLQQGPSSLPDSQLDLKKWAKIWADEARKHKTQPLLYMVWPYKGQANGFALVERSYENAAKESQSGLLPAGKAWEYSSSRYPSIALFQTDRLHPTVEGTYLAALVIAFDLGCLHSVNAPAKLQMPGGRTIVISKAVTRHLEDAAASGLARYK